MAPASWPKDFCVPSVGPSSRGRRSCAWKDTFLGSALLGTADVGVLNWGSDAGGPETHSYGMHVHIVFVYIYMYICKYINTCAVCWPASLLALMCILTS